MNAELFKMISERDANKRARLAATVQADINAMAEKVVFYARIFSKLCDAGITTVCLDDEAPIELEDLSGVEPVADAA